MKFKRHKSVEAMLDHSLPGSKGIIKGVKRQSGENILSNTFFMARTAAGVSQAEMARRLGTTQSAISKMESRGDAITFNDAMRYFAALNCQIDIGVIQNGGIKDRLDYHGDRINDILTYLSDLAGDDPDINAGVLDAYKKILEAIAANFMPLFAKKLQKLVKDGVKLPYQINLTPLRQAPTDNKSHTRTTQGKRVRSKALENAHR